MTHMEKKRNFLMPVGLWDTGAMEAWLEYQAAQGWMPVSFGKWFARFQKTQPRTCRFRLEPQREEDLRECAEREAVYEDLGWTSPAMMEHYQVWCCDDPKAPELYTDPESLAWVWEKRLRRDRRDTGIVLTLLAAELLGIVWMLCGERHWMDVLVHQLNLPTLIVLLAVPLLLWLMVCQLRREERVRRQLASGVTPPHTGSWRKNRRWTALLLGGTWVFWGSLLLAMLLPILTTHSIMRDELQNPLPYVSLTVLDPAAAGDGIDWGGGVRQSSLLAAECVQITESCNGIRAETEYDRLRFAALARALYQERLETAREAFPQGVWSVLDRPGFDSLALMKGEQMAVLVACRDRGVLYVEITGIEDLSDHLEDFSKVLEEFQ